MTDWGKRAFFVFKVELEPTTLEASTFSIVDDRGIGFTASEATLLPDYKTVQLDFVDFNAAHGTCKATYTPGTLVSKAGKTVPFLEFEFVPEGLVPPIIPAPVPVEVINV